MCKLCGTPLLWDETKSHANLKKITLQMVAIVEDYIGQKPCVKCVESFRTARKTQRFTTIDAWVEKRIKYSYFSAAFRLKLHTTRIVGLNSESVASIRPNPDFAYPKNALRLKKKYADKRIRPTRVEENIFKHSTATPEVYRWEVRIKCFNKSFDRAFKTLEEAQEFKQQILKERP